MSMRVISIHLDGSEDDKNLLNSALSLAEAFDGHIDAAYAPPNPVLTPPPTGLAVLPGFYKDLAAQAGGAWRRGAKKTAQQFEAWRAQRKVAQANRPFVTDKPSAAWHEAAKAEARAEAGALADILITHLPTKRDSQSDAFDADLNVMMDGRPVLFLPVKSSASVIGGTALIAWNGGAEAFHAVIAALPILRKAKRIFVCTVAEKKYDESIAQQLIDYLAWHGLEAEAFLAPKGKPAEIALQGAVKACGADILVMGAYTRSRLRELIFGGVTRHFLDHAKVPVLMAH